MFVGTLLVFMGVLLLLDKLGIIHGNAWDYFWPIALIALGVSFITDKKKHHK